MDQNSVFSFKGKMDSIQVLRACLAFLIFLSHFECLSRYNLSAPVFLFYTISGFVVMLSTRKKDKVKGFLKRRFIRLLPLYWTVTIFTFVAAQINSSFMSYTPSFIQLLKSMFCIPFTRDTIVNSHTTMRPIVGPAHTLEVEIIFSIVFFICMLISHKHRGKIVSGVCLSFFLIGECFNILNINLNIDFIEFYIIHNRVAWLYFFTGVVIFKIFEYAESKAVQISSLKKYFVFSISFAVIIFTVINVLHNRMSSDVYYSLQALAGFLTLSFLIILSQYHIKMPRFLVYFGDISFSFYLLHYYIVHITEKVLHVQSIDWILLIAVIVAFGVSLLVASVSYYIFEKKIPKLLLNNKKTR